MRVANRENQELWIWRQPRLAWLACRGMDRLSSTVGASYWDWDWNSPGGALSSDDLQVQGP